MEPAELMKNFIHAAELKDLSATRACVADNLVFVTLMGKAGKEEFINFIASVIEAMPDLVFSFSDVRQENTSTISALFGLTGTLAQPLNPRIPGVKPAGTPGKHIMYPPEKIYFTIENGKITRINPEPGKEGGIVHMFRDAGITLPPLFIMRTVMRLKYLFR